MLFINITGSVRTVLAVFFFFCNVFRPFFFQFAMHCPRRQISVEIIPYPRPKRQNRYPIFRLKMLENDTLWGGTYLYGWYMGDIWEYPDPDSGEKHCGSVGRLCCYANTQILNISTQWYPHINLCRADPFLLGKERLCFTVDSRVQRSNNFHVFPWQKFRGHMALNLWTKSQPVWLILIMWIRMGASEVCGFAW